VIATLPTEDAKKRPSSPKNSAANSSGSSAAPPGGKPRSNSGSSANEWGVKPFNRNFVRALDEFLDRLGVAGEWSTDRHVSDFLSSFMR
jgi:hypothetical protein